MPGQSGNPSGRPKGTKNLATILVKALNERVVVSENGRRRSMTKFEATVKQLVNKGASGDQKFIPLLLALVQVVEGRAETTASPVASLSEAERRIIGHIVERVSRTEQGGKDG